ncbi:MAG TPA: glucose 1-dehydrogenase [Clostridiales bacterium]|nr:glucose 1-dehydrogenase [Clostridiales bacterium]
MTVKDKVIVITGGAGGLGMGMARLLCSKGAIVYIIDIDEKKGEEAVAALKADNGRAYFIKMDITKEDEWKAAIDQITCKEKRIDVLVNNAGINIRKPIEEMTIEEWSTMMLVNTGSVFLGCKYVIPVMRSQGGGAIINTSSVCGLVGHKYTPEAYTATKGAVTLLTKAIASRYAKYGIRCNSIHPSTVNTPLVEQIMKDPERRAERFGEVPLGRLASVEDVAYSVLYLASEEASFINGIALPVDGGVTCY